MSATAICLVVGLALGFAAAFGGFGAFTIVFLFGLVGLVVGRWLEGELDVAGVIRSVRRGTR
ncbi:hypothetical protein [Nocardia sp. NPDC050710]|uniref:hypothetical protein n=1 Tax=Nocardia sp. NPDC050710 TaxID=3157220 RepID=UPI0033EDF6A8